MAEKSLESPLEEEVIKRFKLFRDLRDNEEDERILNLVEEGLREEALRAVAEMIPAGQAESVKKKLAQATTADEAMGVLASFAQDDLTRWQLRNRLMAYLDNLLVKSKAM
ncbi:MAG: hypothetical protein VE98_C0001G0024 [candidate division Kazan bacterium GW2011_GWA1_50_15]|uniref:Uncharacterized protein n=2 Tax=Bacteria division Kazan-3B-28 TaxID=1798534 RepID=A0A0G1X751_UNCK3|nr:MAG: hypothetical protein VE98_C0001G0024 [candidate division Kazan bacterium GW2011_GWA1_50_15]KKW25693.1 MAG: hypothetical protein VE99_C0001G0332 [candidate division Kazan bacterium GW2011_GWC1_52_13]KKW26998.1 MAG: hypothetical protein VF00_C0002G0325 [candidate division Kazan bacterium GW2011_GWB1_52_7]HAV66014.1 hypothetical protein [Patescibacteria group bacterium]HCR42583.1 hypothetical protein [Patescibacteria group bacterium]